MADGDFDEDEVWSVIGHKEKMEAALRGKKSRDASTTKRGAYSASRMIPKVGASASSPEGRIVRQSAPVNIPDWSNVYKKSLKPPWGVDDEDEEDGSGASCYAHGFEDGADNDDIEEGDDDRLPPHEFIARKLARNHITPSSVYEGAGRTLKGRDLKKVRNAVLTSTGFLE
ncbi:uncharacterized protein LOC116252298 [Nymphaea colorata]|nr:uncharacterized protein LOC116252298 [Nymphaea colorata]